MQKVMEQDPDFWCCSIKLIFFTIVFTHRLKKNNENLIYGLPKHANMFSIQTLLHFSQIAPRVCTLVLFIIISNYKNKNDGEIGIVIQSKPTRIVGCLTMN